MLYDSLLIVALVFVVNGAVLGVLAKIGVAEDHTLRPWQAQILTLACIVTFFTLFWIKSGQTLGMQAWRIKLVDFDGNTPSVTLAILRCGGAFLSGPATSQFTQGPSMKNGNLSLSRTGSE